MGSLNAKKVEHAKPGRHADGKGLYLLVKPTGTKSWVLRVQVDGKRRDYGLGSIDILTLAEAREKAAEGRKWAKNGKDPSVEWRRTREGVPTFEEAARRYHESVKKGWRNGKHRDQWLSTLQAHAFPVIGRRRVDDVDAPAVQEVLAPIWLTLPETARRVRQRIGAVLDFAHGQEWRATEAPMRAVARGLPKQPKNKGHFAAMPYPAVPTLMSKLSDGDASVGKLALRFTILTAARSGETRGATWDEIDLAGAAWRIPANRMKGEQAHSIPLSPAAVAILQQMKGLFGGRTGELVFPGLKGQPISDATMAKALRVAGGGDYTVHGFRSSFRDWVAEATTFPGDWAEAALAHALPNRVEAAYRRTKFFDQRRGVMTAWAEFLDSGSNVVALATAQ